MMQAAMGASAGTGVERRIHWIHHHHYRGCNSDRNLATTFTTTTPTTNPTTTTSAAVIAALVAKALFAGNFKLPANAAFTRRHLLRWMQPPPPSPSPPADPPASDSTNPSPVAAVKIARITTNPAAVSTQICFTWGEQTRYGSGREVALREWATAGHYSPGSRGDTEGGKRRRDRRSRLVTSGVVTGAETAGVMGEGECMGPRSNDMSRRGYKALQMSQLGEAGAIAGKVGKRSGEASRRACGGCGGCERQLGGGVRVSTRWAPSTTPPPPPQPLPLQ